MEKIKKLKGNGCFASSACREQLTFGDGESWRPLWSQNVKTDAAVAVDIWVVDSCGKRNLKAEKRRREEGMQQAARETMPSYFCFVCFWGSLHNVRSLQSRSFFTHTSLRLRPSYLWRFEGVVCGEVDGQEENPALVRTVILKQKDAFWLTSSEKCLPKLTFYVELMRNLIRNIQAKRSEASKWILTGPIIVACQWNTATKTEVGYETQRI